MNTNDPQFNKIFNAILNNCEPITKSTLWQELERQSIKYQRYCTGCNQWVEFDSAYQTLVDSCPICDQS